MATKLFKGLERIGWVCRVCQKQFLDESYPEARPAAEACEASHAAPAPVRRADPPAPERRARPEPGLAVVPNPIPPKRTKPRILRQRQRRKEKWRELERLRAGTAAAAA